MRAVAYARCIALFVLLVPALRTPAVIPLALAASRTRACMHANTQTHKLTLALGLDAS